MTAIDGFTKSLVAKLDPEWTIKVMVIDPGSFYTDCTERSMVRLPAHAYQARWGTGTHARISEVAELEAARG
ncbi:hypothetical protein BKA93DRAFT_786439 [Sparassis latifolia]